MNTQQNAGAVAAVKGALAAAFDKLNGALAKAQGGTADAAAATVEAARAHWREAHGVLRLVAHSALARLSEEIGNLLASGFPASTGTTAPSQPASAIAPSQAIAQACEVIVTCMESMAKGVALRPMRLVPAYRDLLRARGIDRVNESDLFFPDLTPGAQPAWPAALATTQETLRGHRRAYEAALLRWLRTPADRGALDEMQAAIDSVEASRTHSKERIFWWVAQALFDALANGGLAPDAAVKRLLSQLNLQIGRVVEAAATAGASAAPPDALLREALFHVARAKPTGERVVAVRAAFKLEGALGDEVDGAAFSAAAVSVEIAQAVAQLGEAWNAWASGEASVEALEARIATMEKAALDATAQSGGLAGLIAQIARAMREQCAKNQGAKSPGAAPSVAIEISCALLMIENLAEDTQRAGASFERRAKNAQARLAAALADPARLPALPPMEIEDAQARRDQSRQLLSSTMGESEAALRDTEAALDVFFRDPATRAALGALDKPLAQCAGVFSMLQENHAAHLLSACRQEIARLAAGEEAGPEARELLALRVTALTEFAAASRLGDASLNNILLRLGLIKEETKQSETQPAPEAPDETAASPASDPAAAPAASDPALAAAATSIAAIPVDGGSDNEMLEVFLEEADEVLAAIETTLPLSRQAPQDEEHLATLRRAFHTLKGSGRMVGLTHMSDAAWEIEQVMNQVVQHGNAQSSCEKTGGSAAGGYPDLYRLLELAHQSFARWIDEIREKKSVAVDAGVLIGWARKLRAGEPLPALAAPSEEEDPPAPGTLTATLKRLAIVIGELRIGPVLYGIFIEEARQYMASLEGFAACLAHTPAVIGDAAFMRAAHTLCGIAGTVGFTAVHDLAGSVERTLIDAGKPGAVLGEAALSDIARAVAHLRAMLNCIEERQPPAPDAALIEALSTSVKLKKVARAAQDAQAPALDSVELPQPAVQEAEVPATMMNLKAAAPAERRRVRHDDDIDPELLLIFLTEAREMLPQIGQDLRDWRARPDDRLVPESLKRLLHTLKGSARMAGAMALGELTHSMETRVEVATRLASLPEGLFDTLEVSYDRLNALLENLEGVDAASVPRTGTLPQVLEDLMHTQNLATLTGKFRAVAAPTDLMAALPTGSTLAQSGLASLVSAVDLKAIPSTDPANGMTAVAAVEPGASAAAARAQAAPAPAEAVQARAVLRVRAEIADRLTNQAGEVSIARARAETEIHALRVALKELTDNIIRLRAQLREIEIQAETQMQTRIARAEETHEKFDPLEFDRFTRLQELSRLMAESVNDVATVQQNLLRNVDEGEAALAAQGRTTRELQDELMRIRMVPFSSQNDRLYRVARLAAKDVGKRVTLDIRGAQAELDRGVMDRIVVPFEHLLRNSIAHGIESPEARKAAGKPEAGEVAIEIRQEGNEVLLALSDDGAGLNFERIRAKAIAQGLISEDEVLSEKQIGDLIFRSGLSTAETVSEIAGRGVGMDVVRNEIAALGGRVELESTRGRGTRFTITLPLTLAVLRSVVLRAGEQQYAVPAAMVEQVRSLKPAEIEAAYKQGWIEYESQRYLLHDMLNLLGDSGAARRVQRYNTVLLLRSGAHHAAIQVDALVGSRELVVKNIGAQLARIAGVTGAAVLGSGETVLVLNPVVLAQRAAEAKAYTAAGIAVPGTALAVTSISGTAPVGTTIAGAPAPAAAGTAATSTAAASQHQAVVMVVDDSLTVRKITSRTLAREGYQVLLAKDGVDALEKLRDTTPAVILTDVEMPRMDGFDLVRNLRADARLKSIPVIMITSRTAEKHRNYAAELGVNVFLGKPYEEHVLLDHIAGFLRQPTEAFFEQFESAWNLRG